MKVENIYRYGSVKECLPVEMPESKEDVSVLLLEDQISLVQIRRMIRHNTRYLMNKNHQKYREVER